MKKFIEIASNFLNMLIVKINEPRTTKDLLVLFGISTTIIFGSKFAQNPKLLSFHFLLLFVGSGLNIGAL